VESSPETKIEDFNKNFMYQLKEKKKKKNVSLTLPC
jgi:hypothetical protein